MSLSRLVYDKDSKSYLDKPIPTWFMDNPLVHSFINFYFSDTFFETTEQATPATFFNSTLARLDRVVLSYPELSIPEISTLHWDEELPFENFVYLKKSSFISFFINNMVDIPICFKKSPSLRYRSFELPILKFSNFLMQKGKREKIVRALFFAANSMFTKFKLSSRSDDLLFSNWLQYYAVFNYFFIFENPVEGLFQFPKIETTEKVEDADSADYDNDENTDPREETEVEMYDYDREIHISNFNPSLSGVDLLWNAYVFEDYKIVNNTYFLKTYLLSHLNKTLPVFLYYICSVDKNVKKYSRGKSGKYAFIWKYVPPYKRLKAATKLIAREVKFSPFRRLSDRISCTLNDIALNPTSSFVWRAKVFSHNYVFKNYRKTLMSTLRTSS